MVPDPSEKPTISVAEACPLLRVSDRTFYGLCARGEIPGAFRVGRQWRIATATFLRHLGLTP